MQWQVRGLNVKVSEPLEIYAERKLRDPLERFSGQVRRIVLRFKDIDTANLHSPRLATACVTLSGGEVLEVAQEERGFYEAVDGLSDRLRRTVTRRLDRRRAKRLRKQRRN